MGITLPQGESQPVPEVPSVIRDKSPEVYAYLQRLRLYMQDNVRNQFSNTFTVATAMNLGTSGTFTISSGGSIIVTSGIVITVTS
jgi:hypothetical protein